jgi:hypothetical protein
MLRSFGVRMPEDEAHVNKEGLKDSNGMTETSRWVHDTPRRPRARTHTPNELKEALQHFDEFLAELPS